MKNDFYMEDAKETKIMNISNNNSEIELRNIGIITLCGAINTSVICNKVMDIIYINELENINFKNIQIILNSPGGGCNDGFMLTDIIEHSRVPVHIKGFGSCESMGLLILCAGEKGHRIITNNTSLLSHQYSWRSDGKYHELMAHRKEEELLAEKMINHYVKHTKLNRKEINKLLLSASDVWITPKEAISYGLADRII